MAAKKDDKAGLIKVTQTGSPIGRHHRQRENLVGLGLNKIGRSKVWPDIPEVARPDRKSSSSGQGRSGRGLIFLASLPT